MPLNVITDGLMHLCTPHVQPLYEVHACLIKDRSQILLLILSEFKQIN